MPALFTTDNAPKPRRLALWQDIVCDVFVQLDCRSDLGGDFHGVITSAMVGNAKCSATSGLTPVPQSVTVTINWPPSSLHDRITNSRDRSTTDSMASIPFTTSTRYPRRVSQQRCEIPSR